MVNKTCTHTGRLCGTGRFDQMLDNLLGPFILVSVVLSVWQVKLTCIVLQPMN